MELDPQCRAVGGWRGPMAVGRHSEDMCCIKQQFDGVVTLYNMIWYVLMIIICTVQVEIYIYNHIQIHTHIGIHNYTIFICISKLFWYLHRSSSIIFPSQEYKAAFQASPREWVTRYAMFCQIFGGGWSLQIWQVIKVAMELAQEAVNSCLEQKWVFFGVFWWFFSKHLSKGSDMLDRDWLPNGAGLDRLLGKGESLQAL